MSDMLSRILRRDRPEAPDEFVRRLAARVGSERPARWRSRPALRAAVVSVAAIVALAAVGGAGYAMSVVTKTLADGVSSGAYAKQSSLRVLTVNAALAQYSTTAATTTTTTAAATTTPASAPPPATSTAETTTTETTTTTATTTATTASTTTTSPAAVAAATAPGSSGSLAATVPGLVDQAVVHWTAASFTTPVQVILDPRPTLGAPLVGSGNSVVSVTVTDQAGNAVHELAAPLEIVFTAPPAGFAPAVSTDGVTFRALAMIAGPPLPDDMRDGFYVSANGDVHVLTRHLTFFAIVAKANLDVSASGKALAPAGSGAFGDPMRSHPGAPRVKPVGARGVVARPLANGGHLVSVRLSIDEQARIGVTILGPSGPVAPRTTLLELKPGVLPLSLAAPPGRLQAGERYRLRISAVDFDGNTTVVSVPLPGLAVAPPTTTTATTTPTRPTPAAAPPSAPRSPASPKGGRPQPPLAATTPAPPAATTPASPAPAPATPVAPDLLRTHRMVWWALLGALALAAIALGALLARRSRSPAGASARPAHEL